MKKTFDCVEMKRKIQEEIYEETKNLSREEELEYFHKAGERFRREMESLRAKKTEAKQKKGARTKAAKKVSSTKNLKSNA